MTLLERRTKEANDTRERALPVGLLRRDEKPPAERYVWPEVFTLSLWRGVRLHRVPRFPGQPREEWK